MPVRQRVVSAYGTPEVPPSAWPTPCGDLGRRQGTSARCDWCGCVSQQRKCAHTHPCSLCARVCGGISRFPGVLGFQIHWTPPHLPRFHLRRSWWVQVLRAIIDMCIVHLKAAWCQLPLLSKGNWPRLLDPSSGSISPLLSFPHTTYWVPAPYAPLLRRTTHMHN